MGLFSSHKPSGGTKPGLLHSKDKLLCGIQRNSAALTLCTETEQQSTVATYALMERE